MFLCIPLMDNCKDRKSSLRVCGRKSDKTSDLHNFAHSMQENRPLVGFRSERGKISSYMLLFSKYNPVTSEETSDKQR